MRDHTKLRAFELADDLALQVYHATKGFPRDERFGLTTQLRRAAVSAASNIAEGCARHSQSDYLRFLDIAYGSVKEVDYQLSLAVRLGYIEDSAYAVLQSASQETARVLGSLILSFQREPS